MRFGRIPLDEAEGAILGHTTRLGGVTFKKGRTLSAADVAQLRAGGFTEVTGARLDRADLGEDAAAETVAASACGEGVKRNAPFTGRCNLFADTAGLAIVDAGRVDRINLVDEAITVATVAPFEPVEHGQMLATIKVIPFAASRATADACAAAAAKGGALVSVAPFIEHAVGLVLTRLPGTKETVLDKTTTVLRNRLEALGSYLAADIRCNHTEDAVAGAIETLLEKGCAPVLVYGASAIVDRRDVVPAAIEQVGGTVDHFGMPVDPGNLVLLGRLGPVPVVGLPGCARSPKVNGFDWVLQRLLAGLPVEPADIMRMGAGGLLKEIASRPQRRDAADVSRGPRAPRIDAIILAAGQSRRMGRINKLLAEIDGTPMVARVVDAVRQSQVRNVVVVTGHEAERVRAVLAGRAVKFAENTAFADGLSASLTCGLGAIAPGTDGVVVVLGDMPAIRASHLDRLIAAFDPVEGRAICVPTTAGKRGNPVLWGCAFFDEMKAVIGDVGARHLIGEHLDEVCDVAIDDDAIFLDIDTPDALIAFGQRGD